MCDKVLQNLQYSQGSYEAPVLHEVYTSGNPASRVSFDLPRSVGKRKETLWASSTFFEFRRKWFLGCCVCQSSSKISLLQENGLNSRVTFLDWKRSSGWLKSFSVLQSPGWSFLTKEYPYCLFSLCGFVITSQVWIFNACSTQNVEPAWRVSFLFPTGLQRSKETLLAG